MKFNDIQLRTFVIALLMPMSYLVCGQTHKQKYSDCIKIEIGAFNTYNKVKRAYAIASQDTSYIYMIEVQPTNSGIQTLGLRCDGVRYYFNYSDSLYTTLKAIENKYREWTEIASKNITGNFEKEIPIDIPVIGVSVWNIDNPKFELLPVDRKRYSFYKGTESAPIINIHMYSKQNYYNDTFHRRYDAKVETISLFSTVEQFSQFVELFNPQTFRNNLGKKTIDKLFK